MGRVNLPGVGLGRGAGPGVGRMKVLFLDAGGGRAEMYHAAARVGDLGVMLGRAPTRA